MTAMANEIPTAIDWVAQVDDIAGEFSARGGDRDAAHVGVAERHGLLDLERAFRDVQAARFHPLQSKQQLRYTGRVDLELDVDG